MAFAITVPDNLEMIVGEQLNLSVDFTGVLSPGDTIVSGSLRYGEGLYGEIIVGDYPRATVVNASSNNEKCDFAILSGPTILNNALLVTISSAQLRPKSNYTLTLSSTTALSVSEIVTSQLLLKVIY